MSLIDELLTDLGLESAQLRDVVAPLTAAEWARPTPAAGWNVATQIGHLAWTDEVATLAARADLGAEQKGQWDAVVLAALGDPTGFVDAEAARVADRPAADLLARWDVGRRALAEALREHAARDGARMPWFGPPMSPASMATARFMETWAHALDVYQELGTPVTPSDRVRHVVHLGVRTRDFGFAANQLDPPTEEFRVELVSPSGERWHYGPEDAAQRVTGSAWDFARLVTQRVHRADTDLVATGPDADRWLDLAQAFAGPPGAGREAQR